MQRSTRSRFDSKRLLFLVAIVFTLLAGVVVIKLVQLQQATKFQKQWRTNILFKTKPLVVVSIPSEPQEKVLFLTLPEELYVQVPYGYGMYKVQALQKLAEIEHKPFLTEASIEDLLHIKLAGSVDYLSFDKELKTSTSGDLLTEFKRDNLPAKLLFGSVQTQLNFLDRLHLGLLLAFLRTDGQVFLNASSEAALYSYRLLPDHSRAMVVDREHLTAYLEHRFEDEQIRKDGILISVINTTSAANAAQQFSQIITAVGGKIITLSNQKKVVDGCEIVIKGEKQTSKIVQYLKTEWGCTLTISPRETLELTVYVGDKYSARYFESRETLYIEKE